MSAMFNKRHYEAIAQALQDAYPKGDMVLVRPWWNVFEKLADTFTRDNPKFSRARFMSACEPGANVRARG